MAHLFQEAGHFLLDIFGENPGSIFFLDGGEVGANFVFALVFLVGPVNHAVVSHEGIHYVRPQEIRLGDGDILRNVLLGNALQDAQGQQHAGGFAANLAFADFVAADGQQSSRVNHSLAMLM